MHSVGRWIRLHLAHLGGFVQDHLAELLLTAAALGGWTLLTRTVAGWLGPEVWSVSVGVLLLSLCGWRYLGTVAIHGLYVLSREEADDGR